MENSRSHEDEVKLRERQNAVALRQGLQYLCFTLCISSGVKRVFCDVVSSSITHSEGVLDHASAAYHCNIAKRDNRQRKTVA